jgi:phosphoesterase RecJ-like protein
MPGMDTHIAPQSGYEANNPDFGREEVAKADLIFCLDFNDLRRIEPLGVHVRESNAIKIMIDHHIDPSIEADYVISDTSASSTCELIYDFIASLDKLDCINETIATCLMTGIFTDTGCFSYAVSPKLFRIVAAIQEAADLDYVELQQRIFNNETEKRLRILGHSLANGMVILPEYQTAVIILTLDDFRQFEIQRGDTEGIVNYLLKMPEVKMAALITDQKMAIKFSLRSKGDFSVQSFCAKHFNGGGHKNASGGEWHGTLSQAWIRFRKALEEYPELRVDKE